MNAKEHVSQLKTAAGIFDLFAQASQQPNETEAGKNAASVRWALACLAKAERLCLELTCPAMEYLPKEVQDAWSSLSDELSIPKTLDELAKHEQLGHERVG